MHQLPFLLETSFFAEKCTEVELIERIWRKKGSNAMSSFLYKTLIVTLSSLFPKVILGYYICKGRGNYAATKTSLQFKQQYNYQIMTKLHNNYTRMTACHAPTTFINKVQFSKNGNWLRSWLTLTSAKGFYPETLPLWN